MITSTKPDVIPTARYSVMETCKILGIARNTLYKYLSIPANAGGIEACYRQCNNKKYFKGSEIERFWLSQL